MLISRREFIKLLGLSAFALTIGGVNSLLVKDRRSSYSAFAQSAGGSWVLGPDTTTSPIHATFLRNGKILYIAGSGYDDSRQDGPYEARILNPNTGSESSISLSEDLFCVGQAQLPNGNILLAGGTLEYDTASDNCNGKWHGLNSVYEFDVASSSFVKRVSMAHGRWYPTCVTLPNGRVFTTAGYDEYGDHNQLVEIYRRSSNSWIIKYDPNTSASYCVGKSSADICEGAGSPCYGSTNAGAAPNLFLYPRMHLMPSGLLVVSGMRKEVRTWDPSNGSWEIIATTAMYRHYGTSILLPLNNTPTEKGKILVVGGSPAASDPATNLVEVIDFEEGTDTSPVVRTVEPLSYARKYPLPIIFPNGKMVVFGGSAKGTSEPVYVPEMFDPETETWTTLPAASVPRVYHSVALLLLNGKVWTAGGTRIRHEWELRTESFMPDYFFEDRPKISGKPTAGHYEGTITIPTPDASDIDSISLVRLSNTTHHYDTDARLVWLQIINKTSESVTVSAPINARIAPPGYYMIHILRSGIPSKGRIIKIQQ